MWECRDNLPHLSVSLPCQATMAELQEVQITEEKPLLPGQTPEVAKVIRYPLIPRPEFQTSKHPLHCLPFQIHNLILTHTPTFSTCAQISLPMYHNLESRPLSCHCTNVHPFHVSCCHLFLSLISWSLYLPLFICVCLSICDITWLCVSVWICLCVSLSRRLS